jgi:hypothetical protein
MSRSYRRYEILLPLRFNDGSPVPYELLAQTHLALRAEFGAVSCETQKIRGIWEHAGEIFRDDLTRYSLMFRIRPGTDNGCERSRHS